MKWNQLTKFVLSALIAFVSSMPHDEQDILCLVHTQADHSQVGQILGQIRSGEYLIERGTKLSTFYPNKNSVVNTTNFQISSERNESVEAIVFNDNFDGALIETINFLPVNVDDIFPNLIFYSVHRCSVANVTKNNFKNLSKLLVISLVENEINLLDEDAFADLTDLKELSLYQNKIDILPEKIFQNLHELKRIELGGNSIAAVNAEHFKNNKKLESISLWQNRIKFLSPSMFDEMKALQSVNLIGNVCIDKQYGHFVKTERGDYANYEFKNFTQYLSEFKKDVILNCFCSF